MSNFVVIGSHGSEDPTQAALPLVIANGAYEAGHKADIVLMGDAVVIAKEVVRNAVTPVGWPPLKDMYATALKNGARIHV
jgi:predicted peroxiredoxin